MPSFEWFISENSGQLADRGDARVHAEALFAELAAWEEGQRDAHRISDTWCERLHADKVAERIFGLLDA